MVLPAAISWRLYPKISKDAFVRGVVEFSGWGQDLTIDKYLIKVVYIHVDEGGRLFDEEDFFAGIERSRVQYEFRLR